MILHKDNNGVQVNAISADSGRINVDGHLYDITAGDQISTISFQNGPVLQNGVNGITNEALLAILIHRTKLLNEKFQCSENDRAIQHMEEALVNLEVRTARRMVRGVEGKSLV